MKKIFVTGSNGQLGSELKVLSKSYPVFEYLFHDIDTLDLTDYKEVENFFQHHKPEYTINCAAYTAVDKAEEDIKTATLINAEVPAKLAELSEQYNGCFLHISTDYVFDGRNYKPYKEEDLPNPQSAYGKSKLAGEQKVMIHNNSVIIRTSWLYSQFGHNFLKTILKLGKERDNLTIIYDQIGTPTNARDLAIVLLKLIQYSEVNVFPRGIYHFSNEGVCSWYDFAKEIIEYSNLHCKLSPISTNQYPLPAKRPHYSVMDKSKIKRTLEIEIPYWKDSVRDCLKNLL